MKPTVIELDGVSKRWDGAVALDSLTLSVRPGELLVLLGGSGSGKTTALKLVNRLLEPTAGTVRVDGEDVRRTPPHELRRRIGYAFQQVGLFPHLTVGENVAVTPALLGWPVDRIRRRVDELLELVELDPAVVRDR